MLIYCVLCSVNLKSPWRGAFRLYTIQLCLFNPE